MRKKIVKLPEFILVGLTARTNNKNEMDPKNSKIATLADTYRNNQIAEMIKNRTKPGITYAVYTEFESDEHGDYTYFMGERVDSIEEQDLDKFKVLTMSASEYAMFTTEPGKMPEVVIAAWQEIWAMKPADFGGKRKYSVDFEVYGEKASDPNNSIVDIYIGIAT